MPEATEDLWKKIAQDFKRYATFPNCIGAIDGKHNRVIKPINSGSEGSFGILANKWCIFQRHLNVHAYNMPKT